MRCIDTGWDEKHEISSEGDTCRRLERQRLIILVGYTCIFFTVEFIF